MLAEKEQAGTGFGFPIDYRGAGGQELGDLRQVPDQAKIADPRANEESSKLSKVPPRVSSPLPLPGPFNAKRVQLGSFALVKRVLDEPVDAAAARAAA